MTGRTHDLAALTALNIALLTLPIPHITLGTAISAIVVASIGGILPDLDQHTSDSWDRFPAGSIIGKLIYRLFGGHRSFSHSILGIIVLSFILWKILEFLSEFIVFDTHIVLASGVLGMISHLFCDFFTTDGIPLLLPIKKRFGFPPHRRLRVKSGGFFEHALLYPGLLVLNLYLFFSQYEVYQIFIRELGR